MFTLYHHPICPFSRQIRVYLKELETDFTIIKEDYWSKNPEYLKINPSGIVPGLIVKDQVSISGIYPVIEYFVDSLENFFFMPKNAATRGQIREYLSWFNEKFYREVTKVIINEKMIRLMKRAGPPRSEYLKIAKKNLKEHLHYLESLLKKSNYLVNDQISCADIAASCQVSVLDFFGEIDWERFPDLKNWYSILKSRPGFKSILQDAVPGFNPPEYYHKIDF